MTRSQTKLARTQIDTTCLSHRMPAAFVAIEGWLLVLILCAVAITSFGQSYSIDWHKVSGGGGSSTGGVYSISGTIGQHDASGPMTGGSYSLNGGYWSIYAVQTPGAPILTIKRTAPNTVVVSWPSPSTGFVLQQTPSLSPANWVNAPQTPVDNGTTVSVSISSRTGTLFFRLKK